MSVLANTYEAIDKTMNVGFQNLRDISVGKTHTVMEEIDSLLGGLDFGFLDTLQGFIDDAGNIFDLVVNAPARIISEIKGIIDGVINAIMGSKMVGFLGDVFSLLKGLNEHGLKGFLTGEINAGNLALCSNLDVLQAMSNGVYVPQNILNGLFGNIMLDWANRVCKPGSRKQTSRMTNKQLLDELVPYSGTPADRDNIFTNFFGTASGYLNNIGNIFSSRRMIYAGSDLVTTVLNADSDKLVESIQFVPMSRDDKLRTINEEIKNFNPMKSLSAMASKPVGVNDEMMRLLEARAIVTREPKFSREEVIKATNLGPSKDALGTFLKNYMDFDENLHVHGLSPIEREIWDNLERVRGQIDDVDLASREMKAGSFKTYDFDKLFSLFPEHHIHYLRSVAPSLYSHRYNGVHPTSEVMFADDVGRVQTGDGPKTTQN